MNLFITILVATDLYDAWVKHRQIRLLRDNAIISNILYNADKYFSLERGVAMSVLYAPPDAVDELFRELDEHRTLADGYLERALDYLERETAYEIPASIKKIREEHNELKDLRAKLDNTKTDPSRPRVRQLLDDYFDIATSLAVDIGDIIQAYTLLTANVDAGVLQQVRLKHAIWRITEYAGREYAVIGPLVAVGEYPAPELRNELHRWRGYIDYGWDSARILVQGSGLTNELKPYMDEAESHYFLTFESIKEIFYDPAAQSLEAPYPIGLELWLEMATQAIDSFRAMQDAILEQSQHYIDGMENKAQREILFSLTMFLSALALSLYSGFVVIYRVIRPVNTMIGALFKAIQGEAYEPPLGRSYADEIGKLGRILDVFQEQARELEERRRYLKTVLATMLDAIITIDSEGGIQMINPAAEKIFGYEEFELIGKNVTLLMPEKYVQRHRDGMKHYFETGEARVIGKNTEMEGRRKNGEIFPLEIAIMEMSKDHERLFVGVLRDITQRKMAEDQIKRSMADLERSNSELDDFAYIASHDLKEPLRGLHNFSGFLIEDYQDKLDDEGKDMLKTIASLTQQMEGLINALLHYSRLGRTELSIQQTNLREIVQSVLSMFSITIDQKGAKISVHDLPTLICDHVRIKEVFQNLIGNALKYNDKKTPEIEVGFTRDHPGMEGTGVFYVRDNGIGIEERNLNSIFKIFRRLHPHHAFGGGTGSGLTIAKKIINQHGGEIWVESEGLGKGTTFYFTIPPQIKKKIDGIRVEAVT